MGAHNSSVSEAGRFGTIQDLMRFRSTRFMIQDGTIQQHLLNINALQNQSEWFIIFSAVPLWTHYDNDWAHLLETCGYATNLHLDVQPIIQRQLSWALPLRALLRIMETHKNEHTSLFVYVPRSGDLTKMVRLVMRVILETGYIS